MPLGRPQWTSGHLVTADDVNSIVTQLIQSYASASARTAAYSGIPVTRGQLTFLRDVLKLQMWSGTAWVDVRPVDISGTEAVRMRFGLIPPQPITTTNQAGFWRAEDIALATRQDIYPFLGGNAITTRPKHTLSLIHI